MSASWLPAGRGVVTEIEWGPWLGRTVRLDPYLVWADLTGLLGFHGWNPADDSHGGHLPLLIELREAGLAAPGSCRPDVPEVLGCIRIPGAYIVSGSDTGSPDYVRLKHITGRVQPKAIEHLLASKDVVRFVLGLPRIPATESTSPPREAPTELAKRVVLGFIDDGCPFAHPALAAGPDSGLRSRVVALWDQDHARMGTAGGPWRSPPSFGYGAVLDATQIQAAIERGEQGPVAPAGDPLAPYMAVDYVPVRPALGQHAVSLRCTPGQAASIPPGTMLSTTHGAGVMSLAMAVPPPLREHPGLDRDHDAAIAADDAALDWRAVFVQLPTGTILDTSGGSLGVHVLDGLHFIIDRAQRVAPDGRPEKDPKLVHTDNVIVATISYGAIAGPHDGSSILERAIDELVDFGSQWRLWVVVAAGNAHGSRTHARLTLRCGEGKPLVWHVAPDHPHESYLEVWLPATDVNGRALTDAETARFRLRVTSPAGDSITGVPTGSASLLCEAGGGGGAEHCMAAVIFPNSPAQTDTRARLALIAVAPTRAALPGEGPARALAPHGEWVVDVEWWSPQAEVDPSTPPVQVHAWTERNDLLYGTRRGQQARVWGDDPDPEPTEHMPDALAAVRDPGWHERQQRQTNVLQPGYSQGTIGGIRFTSGDFWARNEVAVDRHLAGHTVVVGGYRRSDGEMAAYSSGGPDRGASWSEITGAMGLAPAAARPPGDAPARLQPDADAPSDVGAAARGVRVDGMLAGSAARLAGTSAAAPTVARFVANAMHGDDAQRRQRVLGNSLVAPAAVGQASSPPAARPTPAPRLDDAFRRGRWRIR